MTAGFDQQAIGPIGLLLRHATPKYIEIVTFERIVRAMQKYKGILVRRSVASRSIHTANESLPKKQARIEKTPPASRYLTIARIVDSVRVVCS